MTKFVTGGVSQNSKGTFKVRYSTLSVEDTMVRQIKAGNEHNFYVALPRPMDRDELPAYLLTLPEFSGNADYKAVLEATVAKKAPKVPKAKVAKTKITSKPAVTAAARKAA
jgi:hypothetical protein